MMWNNNINKKKNIIFDVARGLLLLIAAAIATTATTTSMVLAASPLQFEVLSTLYPSLDLAVYLKVRGWDPDIVGDPVPTVADRALFIPDVAVCPASAALRADPNAMTPLSVGVANDVQFFTVLAPAKFAAGSVYKLCYENSGNVYPAGRVVGVTPTAFTVYQPVYSGVSLAPLASPPPGLGPLSLTLTEASAGGRGLSQSANSPYFIPCGAAAAGYNPSCADFAAAAAACALGSAPAADRVLWQGGAWTVGQLAHAFDVFIPTTVPVGRQFHACAGYQDEDSNLAWGTVNGYVMTIAASNPTAYSTSPGAANLRARVAVSVTVAGANTALTAADEVRFISTSNGARCGDGSAMPVAVGVSAMTKVGNNLVFNATYDAVALTSDLTTQMCYRGAGTTGNLWLPLFRSGTAPDYVVKRSNPQNFTVAAGSRVGQPSVYTFLAPNDGTTLGVAAGDRAFVVKPSGSGPSACSSNVVCETAVFGTNAFPCTTFAQVDGRTVTCTATVTDTGSSSITVCGCYREAAAGLRNDAMVGQAATLLPRNPTFFAMTSGSTLYGGQQGTVTVFGAGFSASDAVKFITGTAGTCDGTAAASDITVAPGLLSVSNTNASVRVVGVPGTCARLCYKFAADSSFVEVGLQSGSASWQLSQCAHSSFYVAVYPVVFDIEPLPLRAFTTSIAVYTHTTSVQLLSPGDSVIKVVTVSSPACVFGLCNGGGTAAVCEVGEGVNASAFSSGSGKFWQDSHLRSAVHFTSSTSLYVLCVASSAAAPLAPLPLTNNDGRYYFTPQGQDPTMSTTALFAPTVQRVSLGNLQGIVQSTNNVLSAANDIIRIFFASTLPAPQACPLESSVGAAVVALENARNSSTAASSVSKTVFALRNLESIDVTVTPVPVDLALCYYRNNATLGYRAAAYVRNFNVEASNPMQAFVITADPAVAPGGRTVNALQPLSLEFAPGGGVPALSASSDRVEFYVDDPVCRCDRFTCNPLKKATAPNATLVSHLTSGTSLRLPAGFNNGILSSHVVTVCYVADSNAGGVSTSFESHVAAGGLYMPTTYLGSVTVQPAHPAGYTVSGTTKVGRLLQITVSTPCTTGCPPLSSADTAFLIPNSQQCDSVASVAAGRALHNANFDARVSGALSLSSATTTTFLAVALNAGSYRVCYKLPAWAKFREVYSQALGYVEQTIDVQPADPGGFTTFPAAPTRYQLMTLTLDPCSGPYCSCQTISLVDSFSGDCWGLNASTTTHLSATSCSGTTSSLAQINISVGSYTVCYDSIGPGSARIPGTLTVLPANPISFTTNLPTAKNAHTFFAVNQADDLVITVTGSGLSLSDEMYLVPAYPNFFCHDLANAPIGTPWESGGFVDVWRPNTAQQAKKLHSLSVLEWPVTSSSLRFRDELIDQSFCQGYSTGSDTCQLQLCYKRAGTNWAPVTFVDANGDSGYAAVLVLERSNPTSAVFETAVIRETQYVSVIVRGRALDAGDRLYVTAEPNNCSSGAPIVADTAFTSTGGGARAVLLNSSAWSGVVRFSGQASQFSFCYRRPPSISNGTTRIPTPAVTSLSSTQNPFSFLSADVLAGSATANYTQLEWANVSFSLNGVALSSDIAAVSVIPLFGAECPYKGFNSMHYIPPKQQLNLTVVAGPGGASYAQGALNVDPPGGYAFCIRRNNGLTYKVSLDRSRPPGSFPVFGVERITPYIYSASPNLPSSGNTMQLTFALPPAGTGSTQPLSVGDSVFIADVGFADCNTAGRAAPASDVLNVSSMNATHAVAQGSVNQPPSTSLALGRGYTVCYRRSGSNSGASFFAVPVFSQYTAAGSGVTNPALPRSPSGETLPALGSALHYDKNLFVVGQIVKNYTVQKMLAGGVPDPAVSLVQQLVYADRPAAILISANETLAASLFPLSAASDVAALVKVADTETVALASHCLTAATANARISTTAGYPLVTADAAKPTLFTRWLLERAPAVPGKYALCYFVRSSATGGANVYQTVLSPGLVVVYPPVSPRDWATDLPASDVGGLTTGAPGLAPGVPPLNASVALAHERVTFILINTTGDTSFGSFGSPAILLEGEPGAAAGADQIAFSRTMDCALASRLVFPTQVERVPFAQNGQPGPTFYPALTVRFRTPGVYFMCVKRFGATAGSTYFDFAAVGDPYSVPRTTVLSPVVIARSIVPQVPRIPAAGVVATMSFTNTILAASTAFTTSSLQRIFVAPYSNADECLRPWANMTTTLPTAGVAIESLDHFYNSFGFRITSPSATIAEFAFAPPSRMYTLCYVARGRPPASVPLPFAVAEEAPTHFGTHPFRLSKRVPFDLVLRSNDTSGLLVQGGTELLVRPASSTLVCDAPYTTDVAPGFGTGPIPMTPVPGKFNSTVAVVSPISIDAPGEYIVCVRPVNQTTFFLLRHVNTSTGANVTSNTFHVDNRGPSLFFTAPAPAITHGELVATTVSGVGLSPLDRAKYVDGSSLVLPALDSAFIALCHSNAGSRASISAPALDVSGDAPSINTNAPSELTFSARLNVSTVNVAVVCFHLNGVGWTAVPSPQFIAITAPNPLYYSTGIQPPSTLAAGAARRLYADMLSEIAVFGASPTDLPAAPAFQAHNFKLVDPALPGAVVTDGFYCSASTTQSATLIDVLAPGGLEPAGGAGTDTGVLAANVCPRAVGSVYVCVQRGGFLLQRSWAEVPLGPAASPKWNSPATISALGTLVGSPTAVNTNVMQPTPLIFAGFPSPDEISSVRFTRIPPTILTPCANWRSQSDLLVDGTEVFSVGRVTANNFRAVFLVQGTFYAVITTNETAPFNTTLSTPIVVAGCDPCSITPNVTFISTTTAATVTVFDGLTNRSSVDRLLFVPVSAAPVASLACENPASLAASFSPNFATSASATTATFQMAHPINNVAFVGEYWSCYQRGGSGPFTLLLNTPRFAVVNTFPAVESTCPAAGVVVFGQVVTITLRSQLPYTVQLSHSADQVKVAIFGTSCATAGVLAAGYATTSAGGLTAEWDVRLPHNAANSQVIVCYKHRHDFVFRDTGSFFTLRADPVSLTFDPPNLGVGMYGGAVVARSIAGTANDLTHYLVNSNASCFDTCRMLIAPVTTALLAHTQPWTVDAGDTTRSRTTFVMNHTTATVGAATKVCTGSKTGATPLRELFSPSTMTFQAQTPTFVALSTLPVQNVTLALTFTGTIGTLSSADGMYLLPIANSPCNRVLPGSPLIAATGAFQSAAGDGSWSRFTVVLTIPLGLYRVCYLRAAALPIEVEGAPHTPVNVQSSVPLHRVLTPTPMETRHFTVTFPEFNYSASPFSVGDQAKVILCTAASGCNCAALAPACASGCSVTAAGGGVNPSMRVPPLVVSTYMVCFKLVGGEWFPVDGSFPVIPLVPALFTTQPSSLVAAAATTTTRIYQGQRIKVALRSRNGVSPTLVPYGAQSSTVLAVTTSRGCVAPAHLDTAGILQQAPVTPTVGTPAAATADEVGTATLHFPSIGPGSTVHTFPLNFLLCWREANTTELIQVAVFDAVVSPSTTPVTVHPASPRAILSSPATPRIGTLNIQFSFAAGSVDAPNSGDTAYLVYDTRPAGTYNDSCELVDYYRYSYLPQLTAHSHLLLAALPQQVFAVGDKRDQLASPSFTVSALNITTGAAASVVACYRRANGGTVAEVALVPLAQRLVFNVVVINSITNTTHLREYLELQLNANTGETLDDFSAGATVSLRSAVSSAGAGCSVPNPAVTTASRQTLPVWTSIGRTAVRFVAQVIALSAPERLVICFYSGGYWTEITEGVDFLAATPPRFTVFPALPVPPRAGSHITLNFSTPTPAAAPSDVLIVRPADWCHNMTPGSSLVPEMAPLSATAISAPVWPGTQVGTYRVCIRRSASQPWSDIDEVATAESSLVVGGVIAASQTWTPPLPRVGQQLSVQFNATVGEAFSILDTWKVVDIGAGATSCDSPAAANLAIEGIALTSVVTATSPHRSFALNIKNSADTNGPTPYATFTGLAALTLGVCYKPQGHSSFAAIGGSFSVLAPAGARLVVAPRVPSSWVVESGDTFIRTLFTLAFVDGSGAAALSPTTDTAWLVPAATHTCGAVPGDSLCNPGGTNEQCYTIPLAASSGNSTVTVSQPLMFFKVEAYRVCYRLGRELGATASEVPRTLNTTLGFIECTSNNTGFQTGKRSRVAVQIKDGTSTLGDSLRVAFIPSSSGSGVSSSNVENPCREELISPAFTEAMAQTVVFSSSSLVVFEVEWPTSIANNTGSGRAMLCYKRAALPVTAPLIPVCTCNQVLSNSGQCYVPQDDSLAFVTTPRPTYVGQRITTTLSGVPFSSVGAIKIIPQPATFPAAFVRCGFDVTSPTPITTSALQNSGGFASVEWQHTAAAGLSAGEWVVCVQLTGALSGGEFIRVAGTSLGVPSAHRELLPFRLWDTVAVRTFMIITATNPSPTPRVKETAHITVAHTSAFVDDVASTLDQTIFVPTASGCVDAAIAAAVSGAAMPTQGGFMDHSAQTALPTQSRSPILLPTVGSALYSLIFAPPDTVTVEMCVALAGGSRWASAGTVTLAPTIFSGCTTPITPTRRNRQYIRTAFAGAPLFAAGAGVDDGVRTVAVTARCDDETAARALNWRDSRVEFTAGVKSEGIVYSPNVGQHTACYRLGASGLFSPVCVHNLAAEFPAYAEMSNTNALPGSMCMFEGQSGSMQMLGLGRAMFDQTNDRYRFVGGQDACDWVAAVPTNISTNVAFAGALPQPSASPVLATSLRQFSAVSGSSSATGGVVTTFLGGAAVAGLRLCYRDATNTWSDVPLRLTFPNATSIIYGNWWMVRQLPTPGLTGIAPSAARVPLGTRAVAMLSDTPDARMVAAAGNIATLQLSGPVAAGPYDQMSSVIKTASAYAHCAQTWGDATSHPVTGLVGTALAAAGSTVPLSQLTDYIVCYRPKNCGWADMGGFFAGGSNPASAAITHPLTPPNIARRGQLLRVTFSRSADPADLPLGAGDYGLLTDQPSCHSDVLHNSILARPAFAGSPPSTMIAEQILAAQDPAGGPLTNTTAIPCYLFATAVSSGAWTPLPAASSFLVMPANPSRWTTPISTLAVNQFIYLEFAGDALGRGDTFKIIPEALNCSDASAPRVGTESVDVNFKIVPRTSAGWSVSSVAADGKSSTANFTTNTTGRYSVCYKRAYDIVWTLVFKTLVVGNSNPASMVATPASALEGEMFTVQFNSDWSSGRVLLAADQIKLVEGTSFEACFDQSGSNEVIIANAADASKLPTNITFQITSSVRGWHSVCYYTKDGSNTLVTWGFQPILIGNNPTHFELAPATPRLKMMQKIVFVGFGLRADLGVNASTDQIKFLPAGGNCKFDPEPAWITASITKHFFTGAGNATTLTLVSATAQGPFSVCYKLFGGQFHHPVGPPSATVFFAAQSPTVASASKDLNTVVDNERIELSLAFASGTGFQNGDFVYSAPSCFAVNDVQFDLPPATIRFAPAFVSGVGVISGARFQFATTPPAMQLQSLCFVSPASGYAVSELVAPRPVTETVPLHFWHAPSGSPFHVFGSQLLSLTLAPTGSIAHPVPAASDWVATVSSEAECVGNTPASSSGTSFASLRPQTGAGNNNVSFVTAFTPAGETAYLCMVHRPTTGGVCSSTGRDCARTIASLKTSQSVTSTYSPSSVASLGGTVKAELSYPSLIPLAAAAGATVWLSPIDRTKAGRNSASGSSVPCLDNTSSSPFAIAPSTYTLTPGGGTLGSSGTSFDATFTVPISGAAALPDTQFVLCVIVNGVGTFALQKPPLTVAEPVVNSIVVASGAVADGTLFTVTAFGAGLNAPGVTLKIAPEGTACNDTTTTTPPRIVSAAGPALAGSTSSVASFNFAVSVSGPYHVCFVDGQEPNPTLPQNAVDINNPAATRFLVGSAIAAVRSTTGDSYFVQSTPFSFTFVGSSLRAPGADEFAVIDAATVALPMSGSAAAAACTATSAAVTNRAFVAPGANGTAATGYATTTGIVSFFPVTAANSFFLCYIPRYGTARMFIEFPILVHQLRAVGLAFQVHPVCPTAAVQCTSQPTLRLTDIAGLVTADPSARVLSVTLSGRTLAESQLLISGEESVAVELASRFVFVAMQVQAQGVYALVVTVGLSGGRMLSATSAPFSVGASSSGALMNVTCSPSVLVYADGGVAACTLTRGSVHAPTQFNNPPTTTLGARALVSSGGLVPVPGGALDLSGQPLRYTFTITLQNLASGAVVGFVGVTVSAIAPLSSEPAFIATGYIGLLSEPSTASLLQCSRKGVSLSDSVINGAPAHIVRFETFATCSIQPRTASGVDINSYGSKFVIAGSVAGVPEPALSVSLPNVQTQYHTGLFVFDAFAPARASTSGAMVMTAALSSGGFGITGSPTTLTIVGRIGGSLTALLCWGAASGSDDAIFLAGTSLPCATATAFDAANRAIVAMGGDIATTFSGTDGRVVTDFAAHAVGHSGLTVAVRAPTRGETPIIFSSTSRRAGASGVDNFEIRLSDKMALSLYAARFRAKLVYVADAQAEPATAVKQGTPVTITLRGSALTDSRVEYALSSLADCSKLLSDAHPVTATANGFNDEILTFLSPPGTYYVCYSVKGQNATTGGGVGTLNGYSAIMGGGIKFNNATLASSSPDNALLIATIIGGILLFLLLLLICCIVLFYRRWCAEDEEEGDEEQESSKIKKTTYVVDNDHSNNNNNNNNYYNTSRYDASSADQTMFGSATRLAPPPPQLQQQHISVSRHTEFQADPGTGGLGALSPHFGGRTSTNAGGTSSTPPAMYSSSVTGVLVNNNNNNVIIETDEDAHRRYAFELAAAQQHAEQMKQQQRQLEQTENPIFTPRNDDGISVPTLPPAPRYNNTNNNHTNNRDSVTGTTASGTGEEDGEPSRKKDKKSKRDKKDKKSKIVAAAYVDSNAVLSSPAAMAAQQQASTTTPRKQQPSSARNDHHHHHHLRVEDADAVQWTTNRTPPGKPDYQHHHLTSRGNTPQIITVNNDNNNSVIPPPLLTRDNLIMSSQQQQQQFAKSSYDDDDAAPIHLSSFASPINNYRRAGGGGGGGSNGAGSSNSAMAGGVVRALDPNQDLFVADVVGAGANDSPRGANDEFGDDSPQPFKNVHLRPAQQRFTFE